MKCPKCRNGIHLDQEYSETWKAHDYAQTKEGYNIGYGHCPVCTELIIVVNQGQYIVEEKMPMLSYDGLVEEIVYPKYASREVEPEVPSRYSQDFKEAYLVLSISPKASAALARRILQDILRDEFKIYHPNLAREIEDFINLKDVPSYLAQAIDAVRNVGNFAAHPLKDTSTGTVVDVEPGEAEWLLEVIEALFDFTFVQPKRLQDQKDKLNQKLHALGKPPMKG